MLLFFTFFSLFLFYVGSLSAASRSRSRPVLRTFAVTQTVSRCSFCFCQIVSHYRFFIVGIRSQLPRPFLGSKTTLDDNLHAFFADFRGNSRSQRTEKLRRRNFGKRGGDGNNEVPSGSTRIALLISFVKRFINVRSFQFVGQGSRDRYVNV